VKNLTLSIDEHLLTQSREHARRLGKSVIVAAAGEAGCSVLLTEDLNRGHVIAGVQIRNPFQ
jgi:predicted nucleic acid-binding protein